MIIFYRGITCSHIVDIIVSTIRIKSVTPVIISQSCTLNSTCIHTPPIVCSDIFLNGTPWAAGGIIVGVVSGVLIMMMIWGLVAVIREKEKKSQNEKK